MTSTTGAKSMVMPRFRMAWPRCSAMSCTSAGDLVCASTRGDGWAPIRLDSRETRPPSSSTLTASGSGPADAAMSASGAPHHRQVGPAADHDAADVVGVDDRAGVGGVGDPDHQQLRELVPRRHPGQQRRVPHRRRAAGGGAAAMRPCAGERVGGRGWRSRRCGGLLGGAASRPRSQAGQRGTERTRVRGRQERT